MLWQLWREAKHLLAAHMLSDEFSMFSVLVAGNDNG